jgi:putative aminopeptidase FrvX
VQSTLGDATSDLLDVCRRLSEVAAAAGHEDRLVSLVKEHLEGVGLQPRVDRLGQVAVRLGPQDATGPAVMVSAHLDELGLVVRGVDDDGMVRVHRLGGMPERVLPGLTLDIHSRDGDIPAMVGLESHHLTPPELKYVAKPVTDLYLDIGASSCRQVQSMGVRVGDPITYRPQWSLLGNDRFSGKALDDRLGVAALLALVDRLIAEPPQQQVIVGFTTQEEFHVRGALALVAHYQPDIVVNVDVAPCPDTPELRGVGAAALGGGPTLSRLSFHGRGTLGGLIPHPALVGAVEDSAAAAAVNLQYDAMVGVITDAAFVPMSNAEGVAAVGVGIPVRYTHTPIETAQLSDVSGCVELLAALMPQLVRADLSRGTTHLSNGGVA